MNGRRAKQLRRAALAITRENGFKNETRYVVITRPGRQSGEAKQVRLMGTGRLYRGIKLLYTRHQLTDVNVAQQKNA